MSSPPLKIRACGQDGSLGALPVHVRGKSLDGKRIFLAHRYDESAVAVGVLNGGHLCLVSVLRVLVLSSASGAGRARPLQTA